MKRALTIPLFVCSFVFSAQSQDDNAQFLQFVFDTETVEQLTQSPEKVAWYVFLDQQGYSVQDVAPKDISTLPDALLVAGVKEGAPVLTAASIESDDFHPLMYQFTRKQAENTYYRIGDTGKMLIIYPMNSIKSKYLEINE
jgi:hypothetical protein